MFKCDACGKTTQPYEKAVKQVMETRSVTYRDDAGGGIGTEIVKERTVCQACSAPELQSSSV